MKEKFRGSLLKDKLVRFKFRPLGREEDICIEVDDQTGIELLAQFEAKYCKLGKSAFKVEIIAF